ncbi:hypothetical protein [Microbacterium sp. NPDC057650]|uniref:hypothetical protein n=1 Tax=unclassified Microbacterium TaxID=2609290 RepID=UPI00366CE11C
MEASRQRWPQWVWSLVIFGAVVVVVWTFADWSGACPESAVDALECTSGPAVGWPAAWVIFGFCALAVLISVTAVVRRGRDEN